jgi:hypothetical protein
MSDAFSKWLEDWEPIPPFFGLDRTKGIDRTHNPPSTWEVAKTRLYKAWRALLGDYD